MLQQVDGFPVQFVCRKVYGCIAREISDINRLSIFDFLQQCCALMIDHDLRHVLHMLDARFNHLVRDVAAFCRNDDMTMGPFYH